MLEAVVRNLALHTFLGLLLFLPEETLLMEELAGYRDYAAKVRFRFLRGVW